MYVQFIRYIRLTMLSVFSLLSFYQGTMGSHTHTHKPNEQPQQTKHGWHKEWEHRIKKKIGAYILPQQRKWRKTECLCHDATIPLDPPSPPRTKPNKKKKKNTAKGVDWCSTFFHWLRKAQQTYERHVHSCYSRTTRNTHPYVNWWRRAIHTEFIQCRKPTASIQISLMCTNND